jgi:hypothetical protein
VGSCMIWKWENGKCGGARIGSGSGIELKMKFGSGIELKMKFGSGNMA